MDSEKKFVNRITKTVRNSSMKSILVFLILSGMFLAVVCFFSTHFILRDRLYQKLTFENQQIYNYIMLGVGFFYILIGVMGAVSLFFRVKINTPLQLLKNSAVEIEKNNLEFTIDYNTKDELGVLCNSFEEMRLALEENHKDMWLMAEERRILNAAFAHDLRSPLTVLRGYADFLSLALPKEKYDQDKVLATIEKMSAQIDRLENYVVTMNQVQRLEDTPILPKAISASELIETISDSMNKLANSFGKALYISGDIEKQYLEVDENIVLRILENICLNALEHAKNTVHLQYGIKSNRLYFTCTDDGPGFTTIQLERGPYPFTKGDESHGQGMGLYTSSVLCRKHGGNLIIKSGKDGGALVKMHF